MQVKALDNKSFIVEGNIGAGKSTFLRIIQQYLDVQVVYEPLDKWQNIGGSENLLEKFYADAPRWAYTFQTYAFVSRIITQQEFALAQSHTVQILERSVFSDRYCFAKNCFESGMMTALEWKLYQEWFSWLLHYYVAKPTGFIYLQTDPKVCYERLQHRARAEELIVTYDYLNKLHTKHEEWLIAKEGVASFLRDVPVLVVPCDKEFEHDKAEQQKHMESIAMFINEFNNSTVHFKSQQPVPTINS